MTSELSCDARARLETMRRRAPSPSSAQVIANGLRRPPRTDESSEARLRAMAALLSAVRRIDKLQRQYRALRAAGRIGWIAFLEDQQ